MEKENRRIAVRSVGRRRTASTMAPKAAPSTSAEIRYTAPMSATGEKTRVRATSTTVYRAILRTVSSRLTTDGSMGTAAAR